MVQRSAGEDQYLHHQVFHVVELLRVQEGSELLPGGDTVPVSISRLEASFVPRQHGPIGGLVIHVIKLLT